MRRPLIWCSLLALPLLVLLTTDVSGRPRHHQQVHRRASEQRSTQEAESRNRLKEWLQQEQAKYSSQPERYFDPTPPKEYGERRKQYENAIENALRKELESDPRKALERLQKDGSELTSAQEYRLRAAAVTALLEQFEQRIDAEKDLPLLQNLRPYFPELPLDQRDQLQAILLALETERLIECLKAGSAGDVEKMRQLSEPVLQSRLLSGDVQRRIVSLLAQPRDAKVAEQLLRVLAEKGIVGLKDVDLATLPADFQERRTTLEALATIRASLAASPKETVSLESLKAALKQVASLLGAERSARLQAELSAKLYLHGDIKGATEMLPDNISPEQAAMLLRDLQAVSTGEGEVVHPDLQAAVGIEPGTGGATTRGPPPGAMPLLPEGAKEGWRPSAGKATDDLPPLESPKIPVEEKTVQESIKKDATLIAERWKIDQTKVTTALLQSVQKQEEALDKQVNEYLEADKIGHHCARKHYWCWLLRWRILNQDGEFSFFTEENLDPLMAVRVVLSPIADSQPLPVRLSDICLQLDSLPTYEKPLPKRTVGRTRICELLSYYVYRYGKSSDRTPTKGFILYDFSEYAKTKLTPEQIIQGLEDLLAELQEERTIEQRRLRSAWVRLPTWKREYTSEKASLPGKTDEESDEDFQLRLALLQLQNTTGQSRKTGAEIDKDIQSDAGNNAQREALPNGYPNFFAPIKVEREWAEAWLKVLRS